LRRAVDTFLEDRIVPESVTIDMLRDRGTVTGVASPKYYVWIAATDRQGRPLEGVMRIAHVEGEHYEVLQFFTAAELRAEPDLAASYFPKVLLSAIAQRAKSRD
jgi:hypothetical protein